MWCPPKYLSLRQVFEVCSSLADDQFINAEDPEDVQQDEDGKEALWWDTFLEAYRDWAFMLFINDWKEGFFISTPSGAVFTVPKSFTPHYIAFRPEPLLHTIGEWERIKGVFATSTADASNPAFLFSAENGAISDPLNSEKMIQLLSWLNGGAWCVPWERKQNITSHIVELIRHTNTKSSTPPPDDSVARIIQMSGKGLRKEAIKETFANMSSNKFERLWKVARAKQPSLGLGGRPKTPKPNPPK